MNDQDLSTEILSDITVYMKYARYLPEKNRRETWEELVARNIDMHMKKYVFVARRNWRWLFSTTTPRR